MSDRLMGWDVADAGGGHRNWPARPPRAMAGAAASSAAFRLRRQQRDAPRLLYLGVPPVRANKNALSIPFHNDRTPATGFW
jgi:hypothetical protein